MSSIVILVAVTAGINILVAISLYKKTKVVYKQQEDNIRLERVLKERLNLLDQYEARLKRQKYSLLNQEIKDTTKNKSLMDNFTSK